MAQQQINHYNLELMSFAINFLKSLVLNRVDGLFYYYLKIGKAC